MKFHGVREGLDDDCLKYLAARQGRFTRRRTAAALGWSPTKLDAVRRRLERHIENDPLRKERSITGSRIGKLDSFWFPQFADCMTTTSNSGGRISIVTTDLQNALREAQSRHEDLVNQSRAAAVAVNEIETRLAQLRTDAEHDDAEALLLGRAQNNWPKQISALEGELKAAKRLATSTAGAVAKQSAIVEGLQDQIQASRFDRFSKAIADPQARLDKAVLELMAAAVDVQDIAHQHGFASEHYLITPGDLPEDVQARLISVVRAALQAAHYWSASYTTAPEFHKAAHLIPILVASPAPRLDPIQIQIRAEQVRLTDLTEKYRLTNLAQHAVEQEIHTIFYALRRMSGRIGEATPAEQKRLAELRETAQGKTSELKSIQGERQKIIVAIAALERADVERRSAARAA